MADIIGQETWSADGKAYVIKVTEPGATVTENAISIISPVRLRRGSPSHGPLEPILVSQLSFTIRDTSKLFQNALAGKNISDIVIEFTEDGSTLFKGYVTPEYQRSTFWKSDPEYQVSAYDGIAGLKGFTWDEVAEQTVRQQIFKLSDKIGLELTLNTFFEWKHNGADSSTDPPDALRIRVEHLLNEGATYYDVLETLCKFYNAQFFQSGGQWYFMQRSARDGSTMTNYPTNASGAAQTNATVDYNFSLTYSDLHRNTTFASEYPANARLQSKHVYPDYLLKNVDWTEGNKWWDNNGSDEAGTATYRRITINNGYLRQVVGTTMLISQGVFDKIYFGFNVQVNFSGSAPGTSQNIEYCQIKAVDDDGTVNYLTTASAWQSGQTRITRTVTATASTTQTFNATITTATMPFSPARIELELYFDKDVTGSLADTNWIEFGEITVLHQKPDQENDVFRPEELTVTDTTGNLGENVEEEYGFGDTDSNKFNSVGVFEYYDGSDWIPTSDWNGSGQSVHELRVADNKTQTESRQGFFEFAHKFGDRPELYNNLVFSPTNVPTSNIYLPVFAEQTYQRNAKVITRTAAIQQLGASVVQATHVYWVTVTGLYKAEITDTPTFTINSLDTITTGREFRHIKVDQSSSYIFTIEELTASNTYYVVRRDLGGANETTLLTFSGSILPLNFAVDRVNKLLFVAEDDTTVSVGHTMELYTYAGAASSTHDSEAGGSPAWPAVTPDGVDYWYRHVQSGVDELRKNGTDLPHNSPLSESDDQDTMLIDKDEGTIFIFNTAANKVVSLPIAGGSESDVVTGITAGEGMGYDRLNQKLYTANGTVGQIQRCDYDGSNVETAINHGASPPTIKGICLGV